MAVDSVGAPVTAIKQPVQANQQAAVESRPASSEGTSAAGAREVARRQAAERQERPEQPKPVVNAQGQKTGTIINTTA